MAQRVLGPSADPAVLRQQHAQPPGTEVDAGLLFQVAGQALGGPDIASHPQSSRSCLQGGLQGRQIACIGLHRPAGAGGIVQCRNAPSGKTRQPVRDGLTRAPAPAGNARQVVAQRRRFDHVQPFAHAPRQIRAPQLGLHGPTLLGRDDQRRGCGFRFGSIHLRAPLLLCLLFGVLTWHLGADSRRSRASKFTSAYLVRASRRLAWRPPHPLPPLARRSGRTARP